MPKRESLQISWLRNYLTLRGAALFGGTVRIHYLEAFCRSGSTQRRWQETVIPHRTELLSAGAGQTRLRLRTIVEPDVEILHTIVARADEVDFRLVCRNAGRAFADVQWFQPCLRTDRFTGGTQRSYVSQCFIFTARGLTTLDRTRRTIRAVYRGGQVYVPKGIPLRDVNPRPISPDRPINNLTGCFSGDGRQILAQAWDHSQELFQGVAVCLHNDPRLGGLEAGETKKLHGKIYLVPNDPSALLARYRRDFPRGG